MYVLAVGWLAWERFACNTDCTLDPDNCIRSAHDTVVYIAIY